MQLLKAVAVIFLCRHEVMMLYFCSVHNHSTEVELMLERPALRDEDILSCLHASYNIPATLLEFLPIGNDSAAWVYRVQDQDGASYFLKVKQGPIHEPVVALPRYLRDQGFRHVVAPNRTSTGALWAETGPFVLILYPFIDGRVGMEVGLSPGQWIEFGAALRRIHETRLPGELATIMRRETFSPKWGGVVEEVHRRVDAGVFKDPVEEEFAAIWREKRQEIDEILARTVELGHRVRRSMPAFALCHGDIHTANLLLDEDGRLFIVDWDEVILAPKERDLMFMVDDTLEQAEFQDEETALFFQGYGVTEIDPIVLAYYRYEWVVQEVGDYGKRVFLINGAGAATKAHAVQLFKELFQPGDVVAAAYRSDIL
jgi:spectinomycin phosphotransferase